MHGGQLMHGGQPMLGRNAPALLLSTSSAGQYILGWPAHARRSSKGQRANPSSCSEGHHIFIGQAFSRQASTCSADQQMLQRASTCLAATTCLAVQNMLDGQHMLGDNTCSEGQHMLGMPTQARPASSCSAGRQMLVGLHLLGRLTHVRQASTISVDQQSTAGMHVQSKVLICQARETSNKKYPKEFQV